MKEEGNNKREYLLLLAILFIGILLRVHDLDVIPAWQWDEGTNQNIAWNLSGGRLQWYCLTFPFVPHPPLFFIVVSFLFKVFPSEIIVMRYLCVSYGIAAILVIHWIGKRIGGAKIGLMSAFLFSIYPSAIYWNRMGFANNQLMLLILLTAYFTLRYMQKRKERWLYLASFSCGLSIITEY
ncbi:MAG: glycosyltransferase family 39 protein, partial [Candidatus Altiarchaeales archaeon]|nr:glycosyltransferase family 39 protein [Candidatus Altiarchaeales archaeon]